MSDRDLKIKIKVDGTQPTESLKQVSTATDDLRGAFIELQAAIRTMAAAADRMAQATAKAKLGEDKLANSAAKAKTKTSRLKSVLRGLRSALGATVSATWRLTKALGKMGLASIRAGRGMWRSLGQAGAKLRGFTEKLGILTAIGGALTAALFHGMREAMEDTGEGAASASEQVDNLSSGVSQAAENSKSAASKIKEVFGAFGAVGEGFVQSQGKLLNQVSAQNEKAVKTASGAAGAAKDAGAQLDGAARSGNRFIKATDRIGAAFGAAKTKILQAIAKAITPALEKFADLLESPAFQKFVDLLADDMATAAVWVAEKIEAIFPKLEGLMEKINAVGGPLEVIKGKWRELRDTTLRIIGIIIGVIAMFALWLKEQFQEAFDVYATGFRNWMWLIKKMATAASVVVKAVINGVISMMESMINRAVDSINVILKAYNKLSKLVGADGTSLIAHVTLPRLASGGIVTQPTLALIGEAGPEAVVPLSDDHQMGNVTINITVQAQDNPRDTGVAIGDAIVEALRMNGMRLPVGV